MPSLLCVCFRQPQEAREQWQYDSLITATDSASVSFGKGRRANALILARWPPAWWKGRPCLILHLGVGRSDSSNVDASVL